MALTCGQCGKDVLRQRFVASTATFVGIDCGCLREQVEKSAGLNLFSDLTLEHVHDERGKPIRVTSIHQLREAEKRYQFSHHVANSMEKNFETPRQQRTYSVADLYQRKFARS